MRFDRYFTRDGQGPYFGLEFEERTARVNDSDGSLRVEFPGNLVPSRWSQRATDILVTKYFRKAGVPEATVAVPEDGVPEWLWRSVAAEGAVLGRETDARQVFRRIAGCWTYHGWKGGYFDEEASALIYFEEIQTLLACQIFAPNSPQWFNVGLYWSYGIDGTSSGHFRVNPVTQLVEETTSSYQYPQAHACFLLGVEDSLIGPSGIMDTISREALIFKHGSGAGSNFSNIRGEGEPLTGGGKSSGFMSFTQVDDKAAGAIKSGGITRRAAKLKVLDLDHPDIEKYIGWKDVEEKKAASLVVGSKILNRHINKILQICSLDGNCDPKTNRGLRKALREARRDEIPDNYLERALLLALQGVDRIDIPVYGTHWDSETYRSVGGQNSNNSVGVVNDFMRRVEEKREWPIYWRTELQNARDEKRDPRPNRVVKAEDLFNEMAEAAWACGDPGVQYQTTINEWHTCPLGGPIRGSNPCSEYLFINDTACNLASENLVRFYDSETDVFHLEDYRQATRLVTLGLELSVYYGQYPGEKVAQKTYDYRTLGLGYANLGALLMRMGVGYDSPEGRSIAAALTAILTAVAYQTSAEISKDLGPFPRYQENREHMLRVLRNHWRAAHGRKDGYEGVTITPVSLEMGFCRKDLWEAAQTETNRMVEMVEQHGARNAQVTVCAPTGTISFAMDCDTTGCEPDFSLVTYKTLAGGGSVRLVNASVPIALKNLGYSEQQVKEIVTYVVGAVQTQKWPMGFLQGPSGSKLQHLISMLSAEVKGTFQAKLGTVHDFQHLFSQEQLEEAHIRAGDAAFINDILYGHETIEGAPGLSPEHLSVFDCANKPTKHGKRFLSPESHVLMVAAIQPYFSGGISKTTNLPVEATIQDFKDIYMLAWKSGVKCLAAYRDHSKLSSPLGTNVLMDLGPDEEEARPPEAEKVTPRVYPQVRIQGDGPPKPPIRHRLPSRRSSYTQQVKVAGQTIFVTVGEYPDGSPGEVFLNAYVNGSPVQTLLNVLGQLISISLQHGVPVAELAEKLLYVSFSPSGPVQGDQDIKMAQSILDYVGKRLLIDYGDRHDLSIRNGTPREAPPEREPLVLTVASEEIEDDQDYRLLPEPKPLGSQKALEVEVKFPSHTGEVCPRCMQASLRRTGTCFWCDTCNESVGGCG